MLVSRKKMEDLIGIFFRISKNQILFLSFLYASRKVTLQATTSQNHKTQTESGNDRKKFFHVNY